MCSLLISLQSFAGGPLCENRYDPISECPWEGKPKLVSSIFHKYTTGEKIKFEKKCTEYYYFKPNKVEKIIILETDNDPVYYKGSYFFVCNLKNK